MEKEKKQRNNNGEMPELMVNFVTTYELLVGKDVKLDESKASQRKKRSSNATSGKGMVLELELKPDVKLVRVRKRPDPNPARVLVAHRNLESVLQARVGLLSEDPSRLPSKQ